MGMPIITPTGWTRKSRDDPSLSQFGFQAHLPFHSRRDLVWLRMRPLQPTPTRSSPSQLPRAEPTTSSIIWLRKRPLQPSPTRSFPVPTRSCPAQLPPRPQQLLNRPSPLAFAVAFERPRSGCSGTDISKSCGWRVEARFLGELIELGFCVFIPSVSLTTAWGVLLLLPTFFLFFSQTVYCYPVFYYGRTEESAVREGGRYLVME